MKIKRRNLRKLANELLQFPDDYKGFGMSSYFVKNGFSVFDPYSITQHLKDCNHTCETVACALGHGPSISGKVFEPQDKESWNDYSRRVFGLIENNAPSYGFWKYGWDWCFSGAWAQHDNTTTGAALRIFYFLDYGLPEKQLSFPAAKKLYTNAYDISIV